MLNWSIGGYKLFLKDAGRFMKPSAAKEALEQYKRETDPVIDFVEEHVTVFEDDSPSTLLKISSGVPHLGPRTMDMNRWGRINFRKAMERTTGKVCCL